MADESPKATEVQEFEVPTSAQAERVYRVRATDAKHAHERLKIFLKDPDLLAEGIVVEIEERSRDTAVRRVEIAKIKPVQRPKPVAPKVPVERAAS